MSPARRAISCGRRTEQPYYPPTPSVAGPARAPRDLSRDRARACAHIVASSTRAFDARVTRAARTDQSHSGRAYPSAPAVNTTVSANSATRGRTIAKPGRPNTRSATAPEAPSGAASLARPRKPVSGSGFSARRAPAGPRFVTALRFARRGSPSPRSDPGPARRRGRAPRTTTKTPARTFGASPRREVPRDATGPRRRCTRTRASRPNPKPRTARRVSPAAAAAEARGDHRDEERRRIVHPSANRAISGGGEGRSGRALRVVDGTERRGGVLSAGDGVDDGRGRVFVALRAARGGRGGGARGEGAASHRPSRAGKPQRAPWRSAGRRTIRRGPRSIVGRTREAGTPSRRGSATTGGREASVGEFSSGERHSWRRRSDTLVAGHILRGWIWGFARAHQRGERADGRAPHDTSRGQIRRARVDRRAHGVRVDAGSGARTAVNEGWWNVPPPRASEAKTRGEDARGTSPHVDLVARGRALSRLRAFARTRDVREPSRSRERTRGRGASAQ